MKIWLQMLLSIQITTRSATIGTACAQRLKPKCDILLLNVAFKINLRSYNEEPTPKNKKALATSAKKPLAGANTRPRFGYT
jgi:hypothetical protein